MFVLLKCVTKFVILLQLIKVQFFSMSFCLTEDLEEQLLKIILTKII